MAESPPQGITLGGIGPVKVVSFAKDKLEQIGGELNGHAGTIDTLAHRTGAIGIDPPAFGILGMGLNSAHDQSRDSSVKALRAGKAVLDSWNKALKDADRNYKNADAQSTVKDDGPKDGDPFKTGPGLGGLGGGDLGAGGLGGGDLGTGGLGGGDLGAGGLDLPTTDPNALNPGGLDPGGTGPKLPDPGALDPGGLDPGGAGSKLPDPNALDPNALNPGGLGDLDPNGVPANLAKPNLGLDDPMRTALSGYDPSAVTASPRLPGGTTWTGDSQGPGSSFRDASLGGTAGGGAFPPGASRGTGAGTAGGMPMMPMIPPGGGAGGEQDKEREKSTWMSEDEGVWGGDEDIAPPVIGQGS